MSKRRHNFGTKRFKEKSLFIFHARIALKSLILLFVRLIARGARIGKTHTHTHTQTDRQTDRTSTVTLAHARRGLTSRMQASGERRRVLHRRPLYIGGRGLVSQIIEPVTFARCAFIIALRNIALDGYLETRRNI